MTEREIFIAALQREDPIQRQAFLDAACAGRPEVRQEVESLLRLHEGAGSFLENPAAGLAAVEARHGPEQGSPCEVAGASVGSYRLIERIGEGGMGTVWMAQQTEPVKRLVALKLIRSGMDSQQVIARFEAERQALALMDHANIARVLDGGTTKGEPGGVSRGRPYFVMDLVKGVPITRYCDEHRLTPRQRLELFVPVCQAVQHAHQKGIIHRDLKPSNVLVALYDGKPVPKVIDFGVAKAAGQPLTEQTLVTGFGHIIGTLEYMSPEQAEINQPDIDTRSDVYSLGVLLYELLAGSPPFTRKELGKAGLMEMLRLLREQEPAKPSARLRAAEGLEALAVNRATEPAKLTRLVRGDLDWILLKALEKDRNRRYETATDFATDVQRYLADEPVLACPPSVSYRLRKLARRNKGPVLAASFVVLALVGGIIGTTWGMVRAGQARRDAVAAQAAEAERADGERRAKEEAQKRLAQIEKGTEILGSVFRDLDPLAAESAGVTSRELLGRRLLEAAQQLEGEAAGDSLVTARLQHLLGVSLFELGHWEQAEQVFVKASRTRGQMLGADHLDTAATRHHLAMLYRDRGEYALAEALYHEVLAVRTSKLGTDHPETLATQHHLAMLYHAQGKFALAEALYKEVLVARASRLGTDHPDTLQSQHRLAMLYRNQGKFALAEALYKEVLAVRTDKLGRDHLDTAATKVNLAALYLVEGKDDLAEPLFQEVLAIRTAKLGAEHPDTLTSRQRLASLYLGQRKYAVAEELFKEVLAVRTAKLGSDHRDTLTSRLELARLHHWQGNYSLAEQLYKEVLAVGTARLGADHPHVLNSQHSLASLYWSMKKLDLSILLLEETLKLRNARFDPGHPDTLATQADLGLIYCDAERFADAIPLLEEFHRKGHGDPEHARVGHALLAAYVRVGKTADAIALATAQVRVARERFPAESPELAAALADNGKALLDAKAYADAEPLLRECLSLGKEKFPDAWSTHHAYSLLGGALLGRQMYAEAEPLLVEGYEGLKRRAAEIPPENRGSLNTSLGRLLELYDAWGKPDEATKWRKELERNE